MAMIITIKLRPTYMMFNSKTKSTMFPWNDFPLRMKLPTLNSMG